LGVSHPVAGNLNSDRISVLQRLFSTFANGWPGHGLFLQRLLSAAFLFHCAIAVVGDTASAASLVLHIVAASAGILLLLGLWTPVAGTIVAITELVMVVLHLANPSICILLATLGATLAMIGPGAWSIDARLFGRKRIDLPRDSA
jgi:putative oxidoreductase